MKWNNFKKRLQEDIHQQKVEVDVDSIWNAIEPQVDVLNEGKRKKRRFIFWMFFVGLIVLGGVGASVLLKNETSVVSVEKIKNNLQSVDNQQVISVGELSVDAEREEEALSEPQKQSLENSKKDLNLTAKKIENTSKIRKQKESAQPNSSFYNNKNTSSEKGNNNTITKEKNNQDQIIPPIEFSNNKTDEQSTSKTELDFLEKSKVEKSKLTISERASLPIMIASNLGQEITVFSKEPELKSNYIYNAENFYKSKKNGPELTFSAKIFGGVSYVDRSLADKSVDVNALLQIRKKYTRALEASHYGFLLGMNLNENWNLSIGIQHTSIAEKYSNDDVTIEIDSILGITVWRVNLEGELIPIEGMVAEKTTTTFNKKIYNKYNLIDIPIVVGYQREFGKWKAGIETGIFVNLSLKSNGILPSEILEDVIIKDQDAQLFKSKIGVNYHVGLNFSRQIFEKVEFSFSPSARFFPKSFSAEVNQISQKYTLFGGNVGLRYNF